MQTEGENKGAAAGAADAGKSEGSGTKVFTSDETAAIMKSNMALKQRLQEIESAQEKANKQALTEQGKFKELHEAETKKNAALALQLKRAKFQNLALAKGITSDKIISRIDISGIDMDESGSLIGADEIIADLLSMGGQTQTQQQEQPKAKVAVPGGKASVGGPATFDDFLKMPANQRNEWAVKNPDQYKVICEQAKNR